MEEVKQKRKFDSVMARIMIVLIIIATIFSIYMTVKLFIHGFTFR
jgi:hypothetical protein